MSAFIHRKPWATALLALIFGPVTVMLYLGKGRAAIAYFGLSILLYLSLYGALHSKIVALETSVFQYLSYAFWNILTIAHGVIVARSLKGQKPAVWFSRWYAIIALVGLAPSLFALLIRTFLWEPFSIPASSMRPALRVTDILFVSKYAYGYSRHSLPLSADLISGRIFFSSPQRGDIAVFKKPPDNRIDYIKRIVGLPGDRVQIIDGILHINGEAAVRTEIDLAPGEEAGLFPAQKLKRYRERLPNGVEHDIYEAGDNLRFDNTRLFKVPEGHYFALGDNRDNSLDSRAFGPIPVENLVGRLSVILWNDHEQRIRIWD